MKLTMRAIWSASMPLIAASVGLSQHDAALRGVQQAGDGLQQRRSAGAVRADDGDDFVLVDREVHALQDLVATAVAGDDVARDEQPHRPTRHTGSRRRHRRLIVQGRRSHLIVMAGPRVGPKARPRRSLVPTIHVALWLLRIRTSKICTLLCSIELDRPLFLPRAIAMP
jgi:hypothetical protein